ncbi:MAG: glycosyltransferase family 4 protein [Bacteroidota bacterium]
MELSEMADRPWKIVFLENSVRMSGVQHSTIHLLRSIDRSRWEPVVFCPAEGELSEACTAAGIAYDLVAVPTLRPLRSWTSNGFRRYHPFALVRNVIALLRAATLVRSRLKAQKADLLVTKGLDSHFTGGLAVRGLSIPCVWHVQDYISDGYFGLYRFIARAAARRYPAAIIADGECIMEQLEVKGGPIPLVIHNGIDTGHFASVQPVSRTTTRFVIGMVARLTPWKGQDSLIAAFAQLAKERPNVDLRLVGSAVFGSDEYELKLRGKAVSAGLERRIVFDGYRSDLISVLSEMDIFAYTAIEKDTSPLALLTAMAAGLPIVAFDIPGVHEIINHNVSGLLVPVGDIQALANALGGLLDDMDLRSRLGTNARAEAKQRFDITVFTVACEKVFQSVLGLAGNEPRAW